MPDDVAVIAFDGSETFAFDLYYTTVSYIKQPIERFGTESFSILMKQIRSSDGPDCRNVVLNPEIVLLESSKKIR